jgi:UDP-N-acetylglucosamine acyltransferase
MNTIHPSVIIGKSVVLGDGNVIGPGCVIEDGAALGSHNTLWMNAYVGPGTTIGNGNQIHMGAVIGHTPQDLAYIGAPTFTTIGDRNTIREYVTIHRGTKDGSSTVIGNECFFMANAHIAHNCRVGDNVIMVNLASLTGHCVIEDGVFISGMVGLHQFTRVGRLAIISALSAVNKDVPPFTMCGGRPAVIQGLNVVGLRRAGLSPSIRSDIKHAYKLLYRSGLNVSNAIQAIEKECTSEQARQMLNFVTSSTRGICAGIGEETETIGARKSSARSAGNETADDE